MPVLYKGQAACYATLQDIFEAGISKGVIFHPFQSHEQSPILVFSGNAYQPNSADKEFIENACQQNGLQLQAETTKAEYETGGKAVLNLLKDNSLDKLVYARIANHLRSENKSVWAMFEAACQLYPSAFVYVLSHPVTGNWIAATPEILMQQTDGIARTMALASTRPANSAENWGEKEIEEQRMVSAYIEMALEAANVTQLKQSEPFTKQAGTIEHICTSFEFVPNPNSVFQLIDALHPTPAVCGLPKSLAFEKIPAIEQFERRYYAGFVGPFDTSKQEMHLYVNLRCATFNKETAQAFVGGGWTKLSNIEKEWQETEIKRKTIGALL